MRVINLLATENLGHTNDRLMQTRQPFGQSNLNISTNTTNGNVVIEDVTKRFVTQGFQLDIGFIYNSQGTPFWRINQGRQLYRVDESTLRCVLADSHTYDLHFIADHLIEHETSSNSNNTVKRFT